MIRNRLPHKCERCGTVFELAACTGKHRKIRYCSWGCRYPKDLPKKKRDHRQKRLNKCLSCGELFHPYRKEQKYCGQSCMGIAYRDNNNPCWRGGVSKFPYHHHFEDVVWGYGMLPPSEHGHNPIWHPAIQNGDDETEVEKYVG